MTLPTTIRTAVSPAAITKVTRLFNGTIADVLNELLQNARRAGATCVDLVTVSVAGVPTLIVSDNGSGVDDPNHLLTLGQSGWDDDTLQREDPAGMGVFSLAGRHVEIRSYSRATGAGWCVAIPKDAWETSAELTIEPFPIDAGTELCIELSEAWEAALEPSAKAAALYCPLAITLNGEQLRQADFLDGAVHIEEIAGVRIGVLQDRHGTAHESLINFHGVQVHHRLPIVSELHTTWNWRVRVDIIDAPQLQLVLPARKEMVRNEALTALTEHAERAIYHAISMQPSHRLAFRKWARAKDLGVLLPECESGLEAWTPLTGNGQRDGGEHVSSRGRILVPPYEAYIEQSVARAIAGAPPALPGRLVRAEPSFEGYSWYDSLPILSDLRFLIERGGATYEATGEDTLPDDMESGPVGAMSLALAIDPSSLQGSVPERVTIPATVMIDTRGIYGGVDDAIFLWVQDAPPEIGDAVYFIEEACFCYDDDSSSDSFDTQLYDFREDAYRLAAHLLLSEEQATLHGIERAFQRAIRWLIPEGRTLTITATRDAADLAFSAAAP